MAASQAPWSLSRMLVSKKICRRESAQARAPVTPAGMRKPLPRGLERWLSNGRFRRADRLTVGKNATRRCSALLAGLPARFFESPQRHGVLLEATAWKSSPCCTASHRAWAWDFRTATPRHPSPPPAGFHSRRNRAGRGRFGPAGPTGRRTRTPGFPLRRSSTPGQGR